VFLTAPTVPDTLRALRRGGALRVDYACSEGCTVRATISVGTTQIGVGLAVRTTPGVGRVTVRLSAAGRRLLDRLVRVRGGRVVLSLRGTASDASGNVSTSRATLRLTRR
jgi:hypothetical protein